VIATLTIMSRYDLRPIGITAGAREYRVGASATRFYAGEPIMYAGTYSSGVASVNVVVVLTDAKPVIATDNFVGIAARDASVNAAGTVIASKTQVTVPFPEATLIRGRAKTATNVDTDAELLGVLWDAVLFDLTSAVYTIDETAAADTSGLIIVNGNTAKQTLDVKVDARAMRADVV
jgi:hypothetical protein